MSTDDTGLLIQPLLLDRAGMAAAICVSVDTLDQLRKRGCPCLRVPGTKKVLFDPPAVVEWLREESQATDPDAGSLDRARARADAVFGGN